MTDEVEIFVSYTHKDEQYLRKLRTHLTPLIHQGFIHLWHDREISAGTEWAREIDKRLNKAHIILLLVSPEFIASDYCLSVEVERAKERHKLGETRIIPVILRPSQWQYLLGEFQALPTGTKPVTLWTKQDQAFLDVAFGIKKVVEELKTNRIASLNSSQPANSQSAASVATEHAQEGSYTQSWSRQHRGLLVLLLDQSAAMNETMTLQGSKITLAQLAASIANNILITMVENTQFDPQTGHRRNICDIAVFGYSDSVRSLLDENNLPMSLPDLAENEHGQQIVRLSKYDALKGYNTTIEEEQPYWIEPFVNRQRREMSHAFRTAHELVQNWLNADSRRHSSFPPLIINITGGRNNGTNDNNIAHSAGNLRQLRTDDGHVLLFNCYISQSSTQILSYPRSVEQIKNLDLLNEEQLSAEQLFKISSLIPDTLRTRAQQVFARVLLPGARGFLLNMDGQELINFLSWGTRQQRASIGVWPTIEEYNAAFKDPSQSVYDSDIKVSKLAQDSRPLHLNDVSRTYVSVYKMGEWVVRCFFTNTFELLINRHTLAPPPDIKERYRAINDYISQHRGLIPFLSHQIWVEKGMHINGQDWPFIKYKFIQALTLGRFLAEMHEKPFVIDSLAKQWRNIINTLEVLKIAHGDLNITNVLVCNTFPNLKLQLVDFDSMYVPELERRMLSELGDEHFQPIEPGIRLFNSEMDCFSALVIYLSLIALVEDWQLWEKCKADEDTKLLLGVDDFRDLGNSTAYQLLRAKHKNRELQLCLDELESSIRERRMPGSLLRVLQLKQSMEQSPFDDLSMRLPATYFTNDLPS
jgi:hypothetical protein